MRTTMNKFNLALISATALCLTAIVTACGDNSLAPVGKTVSTYESIIDYSSNQEFSDIAEANDGNLIAGGHIGATPNVNVYLVKFDENGDTVWTLTIGSDTLQERVLKIIPSSAGGYTILTAERLLGAHANSPFIIQKISESGEVLGQPQIHNDFFGTSVEHVIQTADNGYLISGFDRAEFNPAFAFVMKVGADGVRIWKKTFQPGSMNKTKILSDGSLFMAGRHTIGFIGPTEHKVYITKTSATGDSLFAADISVMKNSFVFDMITGADNKCKILGVTDDTFSNYLFFMDVDTDGAALSARILYSVNFAVSHGKITGDGGAIICGQTSAPVGAGFLAKISPAGEVSWINNYQYPQSVVVFTRLMIVSGGGYAVTGYYRNTTTFNSTALVIKTDANGIVK